MSLLRELNYDFSGRLLQSQYHKMTSQAHRVINRLARLLALYSTNKGSGIKAAVADIFESEMLIQDFMVKLQDLKVKKSDSIIQMPVLVNHGKINRNTLSHVLEVYLKNHYLKSFGYKKLKLTVDKPSLETSIIPETQEYYDEEEACGDEA